MTNHIRCDLWQKPNRKNNVNNRTDTIYIQNEIKLSWPIKLGVIYDENKTRQLCYWSYRFGLRKKKILNYQYLWIGCGLWQKTKQDNNVTDCIGMVYT